MKTEIRGTQLIFCDLSTPKKAYENYEYGKDFDVYNDLKHKLIERGVPESEIVFIHDAKTDKDKQALFDKMNEGKIRVLIGSTEKCGAGTNVQKRLAALHHLDAPYRPRDLQQRDGRGIRQGNMNKQRRHMGAGQIRFSYAGSGAGVYRREVQTANTRHAKMADGKGIA